MTVRNLNVKILMTLRLHRALFPRLPLHPQRVSDYYRNAASAWDSALVSASAKLALDPDGPARGILEDLEEARRAHFTCT